MTRLSEELCFAAHCTDQGVHQWNVALDASGYIRAYRCEDAGAVIASKASGNLLLDLGHANVALGLVVSEGYGGIVDEGEDPVLVSIEAVKQVENLGLGCPPALALLSGRRLERVELVALLDQPAVGLLPFLRSPTLAIGTGAKQQFPQILGPRLPEIFEVGQLSNDMRVAHRVIAIQRKIGLPEVVNERVFEAFENPHALDGLASALGVNMVESVLGSGEAVKPDVTRSRSHSGFVGMENWLAAKPLLELFDELSEAGFTAPPGRIDGSFADGVSEKVLAHPADATQGDQLVVRQVDQPSVESRAVLSRTGHALGKLPSNASPGAGNLVYERSILRHLKLGRRQVENLSVYAAHYMGIVELDRGEGAALELDRLEAIGSVDLLERASGMAFLAAALASAFPALALGSGLVVAVAAWGLGAVAAVHLQPSLHFLDAALEVENEIDDPLRVRSHRHPELPALFCIVTALHGVNPLKVFIAAGQDQKIFSKFI